MLLFFQTNMIVYICFECVESRLLLFVFESQSYE